MTSSLAIERDLSAEPSAVWRALTDADELGQWFWPPRLEATVEADAQVGGSYRVASAPAEMVVSGEYRIVEPVERLVFTWQWDGEDAETLVEVRLERLGDGTRLALAHGGFPTTEARDEHAQGWQDCLERLPGHLADRE